MIFIKLYLGDKAMGVKDVTSDFECIDNHKVYAFLEGLKVN